MKRPLIALSEENVIDQITALLKLNGARVNRVVERIPYSKYGRHSEGGIPDLFGWFHREVGERDGASFIFNTHFFIEVKRPGGKLRPAQKVWLEAAQRDGVIAFKAESLEECVAEFKKFGIQVKGL